eukprot:scaffold6203_cov125-Cylindrotheca_fusiformis.AAC.1
MAAELKALKDYDTLKNDTVKLLEASQMLMKMPSATLHSNWKLKMAGKRLFNLRTIYLGFNPDSRSGHLVMDLDTGEQQPPLKIRALPMTDEVIQCVHQLAPQRDGVRTLTFANRRSEPIHFPDADLLAGMGVGQATVYSGQSWRTTDNILSITVWLVRSLTGILRHIATESVTIRINHLEVSQELRIGSRAEQQGDTSATKQKLKKSQSHHSGNSRFKSTSSKESCREQSTNGARSITSILRRGNKIKIKPVQVNGTEEECGRSNKLAERSKLKMTKKEKGSKEEGLSLKAKKLSLAVSSWS